jgi:hypothetical protein
MFLYFFRLQPSNSLVETSGGAVRLKQKEEGCLLKQLVMLFL